MTDVGDSAAFIRLQYQASPSFRTALYVKYYFRCPKCGNDEKFVKPSEEIAGLGLPTYILGGLFLFLLFSEHLRLRVLCVRCNHIFRPPPPPKSALTRFAGTLAALTLLCVTMAIIAISLPDSADALPEFPLIMAFEAVIQEHIRVTAYFITLFVALILVSSLVTAWVSDFRHRRELSKKYLMKPSQSPGRRDRPSNVARSDSESLRE